jgi:LacI family transcriptional regulator
VLLSHKVDGVILIDIENAIPKMLERIQAEHIPFIHVNTDTFIPAVDQIMVDNHHGGYLVGQYLLRLKHRHIGCIEFSKAHKKTRKHESPRIGGFRQALAEGGIELAEEDLAFGNGRYEDGYTAMQELLQRLPDLTAVFVFNDLMALGAMNAIRAQGRRIPEDISVIGFDNILYASIFEPALTTIAQPIVAMGQECITQLLERIHQPEKAPTHITLPVELIERASCRCL